MSDSDESGGPIRRGLSSGLTPPDCIPGPEEPEQAPPSPDYVPGPEHADDEIVAEDQPYAEDASPIAQSPEYVPESDFEAHPEDDDDEDPEEDPVDYPADGGDDGDDEEESSKDDEDDDMDIEADEEEEHPALADSIPFPPLPSILSPPSPVLSPAPPPNPIHSLGYRAAMIRLRAEAASASHSPPLQLPSASRREDRPEVALPPRKKLGITLGPRYEVGESSSAAAARPAGGLRADYGFVATMDREIMRDPEREIGYGITDSWEEIVETLQGAPTERQLLAGRLNMLFRDRRAHAYTRHLMETKARMSRESWVRSTDASDLVRGDVMSLRTTVLSQMTEIREEDRPEVTLPPHKRLDITLGPRYEAPPSPDYIPGPEEPEQAPPSPDYVPGPEHANDEIDDDDEDPKEDPVDYPTDGGDGDDDEEGSSEDDEDDDMDIKADEEEEEVHPDPADFVVVASTAAVQAPSAKETKPFKTNASATTPPPHPAYRMTARISIPAPVPVPAWSDSEFVRLLAMSSPPA
nr:hypothetical protein [Tanacetum cinerariifolium]